MSASNLENAHLVREIELTFITNPNAIKVSNPITDSASAEEILRAIYPKDLLIRESFLAVFLDNAHNVIGYYIISKGGTVTTLVDIKLLFSVALKCLSQKIILCHNHPSGTIKPSQADLDVTNKIINGGKLLDITILDHIILTEDCYYSFADNDNL